MKRIIYISIVDIAKKNGQGIYALKILESFLKKDNIFIDVIVPYPYDPGVLKRFKKKNVKLHLLKKKREERNVLWHLVIQVQLLIILLILGKKDKLIYSVKPSMFAPLIYSKIFKTPIYLLVEGLAKNSIRKVIPNHFIGISLRILERNIKKAEKVYPAYQSAKKWVDSIRQNTSSEIIHCGVDQNIFKPLPNELTQDKLVIGYVGSFRKEHMILPMIKAMQGLNVRLLLVGDGKERVDILNFVELNNMSEYVIYLGKKDQDELPEFFSKCDVLTSITDVNHWGIPIKGFEYLSCNKKVIFTYKKDLDFVISNRYGYVLNSNKIEDIRKVILIIMEDKKSGILKDNHNSRKYIIDNNNWDTFANKIL